MILVSEDKKERLKHWCEKKIALHKTQKRVFFKEREIWWVYYGENLGTEQNGSGTFSRPAIVLRKYNLKLGLFLPLTTSNKENSFYFRLGLVGAKKASAILSQARVFDVSRLQDKIQTLNKETFVALKDAFFKVNNFPPPEAGGGRSRL